MIKYIIVLKIVHKILQIVLDSLVLKVNDSGRRWNNVLIYFYLWHASAGLHPLISKTADNFLLYNSIIRIWKLYIFWPIACLIRN